VFVFQEAGLDHIGYGALLFVALSDSGVYVSSADQALYLADKVTNIPFTGGTADHDKTLDRKNPDHQEQSQKNRYDDPCLVNHSVIVARLWLILDIVIYKVRGIPHDKLPYQCSDHEADYNCQTCKNVRT